jgi:hypothetical protein
VQIYVPTREAQCLSHRRNWDPPPTTFPKESVSPLNQRGGKHSPAGERVGESQFGRVEKKPSTLSTLWDKASVSLPTSSLNLTYLVKLHSGSSSKHPYHYCKSWAQKIKPDVAHTLYCINVGIQKEVRNK